MAEPRLPLLPSRPLHRRAARHVGRGAHRLLRWIGAFAAVLILVLLFGIWRLMQGPIELDWLTPYVEAALDRSDIGLKVQISGVRFGIDRHTHQLDFRAENVRLALPDGRPLARFPEMTASLAVEALLRGRIEPTRMVVERPVLHLVRDAAGAISARIGSGDQAGSDVGPGMLQDLAGPPQRDAPFGLLHRISIRGATVIVDDQRNGRTWSLRQVDVAINRTPKGAAGDVAFALPLGGGMPELHASYRYLAERQMLDLDLAIDGVKPAALLPLFPELPLLRHVEAPLSGTLRTRIDLQAGQAQGARLDLALGQGRVDAEMLPSGAVEVEKAALHASYAPESGTVRLENSTVDLGGGARLVIEGTVSGITPELIASPAAPPPGRLGARFAAALEHVPADRLGELWPETFSPGGREWTLANVHDGMLDEASLQLAVDVDPVRRTASVLSATGGLRYHGLTVGYLKGLPPVRHVDGTAVFADHHLDFTPTAGVLKGLRLTGGLLRLSDLGEKTEWLTIDLALVGPLKDALEVLDQKPLNYARAIGLDPAHVAGRTEAQLHFKLPLLADLKLDAIDYGAKATIASANIGKAVLDRTIDDGNLALDLSHTGAHLRGTARFDGIPATLDAKLSFNPKREEAHALYRVAMTLDDAAQRRLGLDFAPERLTGPIALDAVYATYGAKRGEATALLDLRGAALTVPEADWKKPAGQPGTARIVLDLDNDRITRIRQIDVTAPGLDGRMTALLADDRRHIERIDIRHLTVGNNELSGTVARRPGGGWQAEIHAARIDARHLMKGGTHGAPTAAAEPSPPLALDARIDRLVFGPGRELRQVNAALFRTGGSWQSARVDGRYANGHSLSLRFGENGSQRLAFQSDDLGATLKLLDIADNVVGGRIAIDGQYLHTAGARTLRARIEGANYTIVRAPGLARILALPSLTGFASLLSGTGLPFTSLRGDIVYTGNRVNIEHLLAYGESLGITAKGWIDLDRDRLELQGTVAPAYALNSMIGNIPIIGVLGGGSQGLLAANYRLSGPSADPQVAVNPLSALAPGFLRQLFAPIVGFPPVQQDARPAPH